MVWSPLPDFHWTPLLHAPVLYIGYCILCKDLLHSIFMLFHVQVSLLHRYFIISSCSWPLIHGYSTPPFHVPVFALSLFWHVLVLTLHGYSRTRGTVFARRYMFYWTVIACTHGHILRIMYCTDIVIISISHCCIDSPACMWWLSLYSCYIDYCSCHMDYCYMRGLIFLLHDCFPSLLY